MAKEASTFNAQVTGVMDARTWASSSVDERRARLERTINDRLTAARVPQVDSTIVDRPSPRGQLDPEIWTISFREQDLRQPTLSPPQADALATICYHEGRHAQQWFRMAQRLAQDHFTAEAIASGRALPAIVIRPDVAEKAVRRQRDLTPIQAVIASHWLESLTGKNLAQAQNVERRGRCAVIAFQCAQIRLKADPQNRARQNEFELARVRRDKAIAAYKDLPVENDAYATASLLNRAEESDPDPNACTKRCRS